MTKYIIRANASKLSFPDYFATDDKDFADRLKESGWIWIEIAEITKHDRKIEGALKRCSLGSQAERRNLRALFNMNSVQ